jgi:hypothetical protein
MSGVMAVLRSISAARFLANRMLAQKSIPLDAVDFRLYCPQTTLTAQRSFTLERFPSRLFRSLSFELVRAVSKRRSNARSHHRITPPCVTPGGESKPLFFPKQFFCRPHRLHVDYLFSAIRNAHLFVMLGGEQQVVIGLDLF